MCKRNQILFCNKLLHCFGEACWHDNVRAFSFWFFLFVCLYAPCLKTPSWKEPSWNSPKVINFSQLVPTSVWADHKLTKCERWCSILWNVIIRNKSYPDSDFKSFWPLLWYENPAGIPLDVMHVSVTSSKWRQHCRYEYARCSWLWEIHHKKVS